MLIFSVSRASKLAWGSRSGVFVQQFCTVRTSQDFHSLECYPDRCRSLSADSPEALYVAKREWREEVLGRRRQSSVIPKIWHMHLKYTVSKLNYKKRSLKRLISYGYFYTQGSPTWCKYMQTLTISSWTEKRYKVKMHLSTCKRKSKILNNTGIWTENEYYDNDVYS